MKVMTLADIYTCLQTDCFVICLKLFLCLTLLFKFCESATNESSKEFFPNRNPLFTNEINFKGRTLLDQSVHENVTSSRDDKSKLREVAMKVFLHMKEISDKELGIPKIQDIMGTVNFDISDAGEMKYVKKLQRRLDIKVATYVSVLNQTVAALKEISNRTAMYIADDPCIYLYKNANATQIMFEVTTSSSIALNMTELFSTNIELIPAVNLQYFISHLSKEHFTHVYSPDYKESRCHIIDDSQFQRVYLNTFSQEPKHIVLIVDHGSALSHKQLAAAIAVSKQIISSLSHGDRIGLIGLTDVTSSPNTGACSELSMLYVTENTKPDLLGFVASLTQSKGSTNHSLGFETAFSIIKHSVKDANANVIIIYISRGLLSSITEPRTVLQTISRGQDSVQPTVIINTCVLFDGEKPLLYEKNFLKDVAQQRFVKYNITSRRSSLGRDIIQGVMETVMSTINVGPIVRRLCVTKPVANTILEPVFFLPQWDLYKKTDLVVTIAQPVLDDQNKVVGVFGIDVNLDDLFEDVIYYNDYRNSYAFVIDLQGYVLVHQSLKKPGYVYDQPIPVDISFLETNVGFDEVRNAILCNASGYICINASTQLVYSWQHLKNAPYIVVVVVQGVQPGGSVWLRQSSIMPPGVKLVYHRLDLLTHDHFTLCRNFRQLSSFDTGSLYLSPWCFQSPFKYLSSENNVSHLSVQSYMAYLKDNTKLLANPGLKASVRGDVISVVHVLPYWKERLFESSIRKYVVRRYVATTSGAVVMYPGGVTDHKLDPLRRAWYVRAIQNQGTLVLTAPYLDSGGAGYIVTLSATVGSNPVSAVVGIDLTLGYLYNLLLMLIPFCSSDGKGQKNNVKCFLMDDKGYLIVHPSLIDPKGKGPAEEQHITHKESLLANDILNHKGLVRKLVCNDFATGTVQRYYQFNTSMSNVITNMISGDQCVRYQLTAVHGTNLFLGVVNTTCDLVTAFCPCNTIDRHCLNCNRLEQTECECPCECPLDTEFCNEPNYVHNNPCPNYAESSLHIPQNVLGVLRKVKTCFPPNCEQYTTHRTCLGILGCEWCQLKADALTPLSTPFCTVQAYCFNGVLGSPSYYGDASRRAQTGDIGLTRSMPVGSVGGGVIALLLALSLMVYCYRAHSRTNRRYLAPDTSVNMFIVDKGHPKLLDDTFTGGSSSLVANAQEVGVALLSSVAVSVSPYRMSSGYRRPPTGDSDHGYSTMTPHEDTEIPEAQPPAPAAHQTLLPHHILAPVTVHMVMDT